MRLALFQRVAEGAKGAVYPGLYFDDGILDYQELVNDLDHHSPQRLMVDIIDHFDVLRPDLERLARSSTRIPFREILLRAPLPRPGKMLNCIGNYWEHQHRDPRPLNMFLKNPDAVIGPGDTMVLPDAPGTIFEGEAELAFVIGKRASNVKAADAYDYIFGYMNFIDGSARGLPPDGSTFFQMKSRETFAPLGRWLVTADEIPDPHDLQVRLWVNEDLKQD